MECRVKKKFEERDKVKLINDNNTEVTVIIKEEVTD